MWSKSNQISSHYLQRQGNVTKQMQMQAINIAKVLDVELKLQNYKIIQLSKANYWRLQFAVDVTVQ